MGGIYSLGQRRVILVRRGGGTLQWLILALFAALALASAAMPSGSARAAGAQRLLVSFAALCAGAAAIGSRGRFRIEPSGQSLMLGAGLGGLCIVSAAQALAGSEGSIGESIGPASRLAFALALLLAASDPRFSRRIRERTALLAAVVAAGIVAATAAGVWASLAFKLPSGRAIEWAALAVQVQVVLALGVAWRRNRRPQVASLGGASVAMAIGGALFIASPVWSGGWWLAHAGLPLASGILIAGAVNPVRKALGRGDLELHYQPKMDLCSGRIVGVEALVRWRHPEFGLISPMEFIPQAEESGLIRILSLWVLETALRQCRAWRRAGLELNVAVNLSARILDEPSLAQTIASMLARFSVDPGALELELTESAVMADPAGSAELLGRLEAMGVRLSIDDFGTGYSSLAYLRSLPVHEIKIDKEFVTNMASDDRDAKIVRSTIDLAHSLNKKVVAEGVEDQEVRDLLGVLKCDLAQGFFWSPPMPADQLGRWARGLATA